MFDQNSQRKIGGVAVISREQSYASTILRLLVDGVIEPAARQDVVWGELLQIAAQNGVLIRVVDQLKTIGLEPRHFFSASVHAMRARNYRMLALIQRIGERCHESEIDFIFAKSFQNYPDMVGDIDLYISARSLGADRLILRGLRTLSVKRNLRNRIDGSANYKVRGVDSMLEIHHGRLGMLGEHKLYIRQLIENGRYVTIDGGEFLAPAPEDQLILQALQRLVQRSYLRLSDVITTINLCHHELNWDYILKTSKALNILFGLRCYLHFIEQIHQQTFKRNLVPPFLLEPVESERLSIEFRNGFYRFQRLQVGARGYLNKFFSAVFSRNWSVATRLSLLPVLGLTTIYRKVRMSS